jgi:hypothetical protein
MSVFAGDPNKSQMESIDRRAGILSPQEESGAAYRAAPLEIRIDVLGSLESKASGELHDSRIISSGNHAELA